MRITAENLACVRGDRLIFRGLSFDVPSGAALVLVGPNGSGKTTLLRLLAGLLSATAGVFRFSDEARGEIAGETRDRSLHLVSHSDAVRSALSVAETLRFHADLLGAEHARVEAALAAWDIERLRDVPGALLSAGQGRRVSLARLSLQERPVWLLDEPLVALDRGARARLLDACAAHRVCGGTIVAASHEPFLDDAGVLDLGRRA